MRCPVCHRRLAPGAACPVNGVASGSGLPLEPLAIPDVPGLSGAALLGVGGFAHVFTAVRESDGREVALKVGLGPHHARFAHEAEALRRVGPPTVPEVLGEGRVGSRPFLVQELLRGQTLAAWMAALPGTGAASVARVRELLTGLCPAVARVHAVGVAHRDLKPENIFLREGGALSLLDFGLARWTDAGPAEEAGNRAGTTVYMAPEQCLDAREAGPAADIYALGVLLFELLTGTPPFNGTPDEVREGHVSQRPPRVSERASVPVALDAVVARCLSKEPAERYASAEEVLAAFEAACAEGPSLAGVVGARDARPAQALVTFAGARPVAVLGLRTAASVEGLAATLEPFGGVLARVAAGGYLLVFCESLSAEANVRAGALAARRLVESGEASAVLHVAVLYVHPGTTLPRIAGAALERPETWWGRALAQGEVRVTPEAVARLEPGWIEPVSRESTPPQAAVRDERAAMETARTREASVPHVATEGARALDSERETEAVFRLRLHEEDGARADGEPPPFVGRDALLEALVADAARSLSSSAPGLSVLTGEVGHGKSRLLKALALQLESAGHARVVRLRAPPPDASLSNSLLDALRAVVGRPSAEPRILGEALVAQAREAPLVLLLDDAHLADPLSLDVLERATLAGPRAPLWICVAGRPSLLGLRPHLGERSAHASRHTLPPLPPEASRAVLVHLLRPAEHIPEPVLARLELLAQGVPLSLVELARALRAAGALRSAPGGGWYVAPDALLDVSVTPLFERLAPRALAGLPEAHRVLARLCAVLGTEVDVARVDAALRHLTTGPELSRAAALDAGAGLQRLTRAGLLRPTGPGRFTFRHPLLREALEALLPPAPRRALHAAALKASVGEDVAERRRRAHHAAVCGAHLEASRDYLALAEEARSGHLSVEAEQHYTRALALLPESDDARRAQALAGRGKVRHRLQRFRESLADLSAARALARTRGDASLEVDLLLEEATARDWMEDSDGSAACTREALDAIEPLDAPRLSLRCGLARGRLHVRQGEWAAAARVLTSTAEGSERARDHETLVVSLALLGAALTFLDRAPEAAERFDEALERCEAAGDGLHKAAVLSNRVLLWLRQGDVSRMEADLRRAMALGRELGHAQMERWSTFNLAEVLYMQGRLDEALPLAQRAHELGVRFFREHPVPVDALLIARIQAAAGDEAAAARQLAWISERCPPESLPPTAIMRRLVELQVHQQSTGAFRATDWAALHTEADALASPDEKAEILLQATGIARRTGAMDEARAWLERAGPAVAEAPLWATRFHALRAALAPPAL
ncbi:MULTISPECIES: serine/threonine-protein kinase [unclassified Corallococcus]|uniref:serine/threonine-protein kinase n=1 Tax=unclassified Corallococcus TaxID=2685029 RepID=UPI001A8C0FD1|nr:MULTISPECIES: serine/threonine-protein kinase [unclassified Corallococcus]MBN9683588.1 protein kinase [Corallococcus sp. NCSPR001]WAS84899.1 protein kinase [Corallococcus sp. NCRR]